MTTASVPAAGRPRRRRGARGLGVVTCAVLALALLASCSEGSNGADSSDETTDVRPSEPEVLIEELSEGTQSAPLEVSVDGPVQVNHRKITIPPGETTGQHCHHGNLIGVVEQGTLTHYAPIYPDGVHEYNAGDSLVEGPDYVHEGRNEGTEDVVLWVTYLTPTGEPLAETDPAACDAP